MHQAPKRGRRATWTAKLCFSKSNSQKEMRIGQHETTTSNISRLRKTRKMWLASLQIMCSRARSSTRQAHIPFLVSRRVKALAACTSSIASRGLIHSYHPVSRSWNSFSSKRSSRSNNALNLKSKMLQMRTSRTSRLLCRCKYMRNRCLVTLKNNISFSHRLRKK